MIGSVPISNLHGHKRALTLGQASEAMYSVPKSGQSRQIMSSSSCVHRPTCRKWKRLYSLVWLSFIDLTTSLLAMLEDFGKKAKIFAQANGRRGCPWADESLASCVTTFAEAVPLPSLPGAALAQNQAGWGSRREPGPRASWTNSTSLEPSISSIG